MGNVGGHVLWISDSDALILIHQESDSVIKVQCLNQCSNLVT